MFLYSYIMTPQPAIGLTAAPYLKNLDNRRISRKSGIRLQKSEFFFKFANWKSGLGPMEEREFFIFGVMGIRSSAMCNVTELAL